MAKHDLKQARQGLILSYYTQAQESEVVIIFKGSAIVWSSVSFFRGKGNGLLLPLHWWSV